MAAPPPNRPVPAAALWSSFPFRLGLIIAAISGAVAVATLAFAQARVGEDYQSFLREEFEARLQLFLNQREQRLASARNALTDAFGNPRMVAAVEPGLAEGDWDPFYNDFRFLLREVNIRYTFAPPDGPVEPPVFRFVTNEGQIVAPRAEALSTPPRLDEEDLRALLAPLAAGTGQLPPVGYLRTDAPGHERLYEVLVVPFFDFHTGYILGEVVYAVPASAVLAQTLEGGGAGLAGGLVVGGQAYGNLPPDLKAELVRLVQADPRASQPPPRLRSAAGREYLVYHRYLGGGSGFEDAWNVSLFPLDGINNVLAQVGQLLVLFSLAAVGAGAVLGGFAAWATTRPILTLARAAERIEEGDFAVRVPARARGDELDYLARSFNGMAEGLAQREKLRSVLDKVTDRAVAEELLRGEILLGGELRDVSVLFCDIRGFTKLTETMDPQEVIAMLIEHMTALTRVVYAERGVVDKFVGDNIMALFGAPKGYGRDAANAARAALAMIAERQRLNREGRWNFEIGVGVASGRVVAGNMGSQDRLNYTVLGQQVNLAARLCGAAAPGEVLIDQTTLERLEGGLSAAKKTDLALKGFSEPVPAYCLRAVHPLPAPA